VTLPRSGTAGAMFFPFRGGFRAAVLDTCSCQRIERSPEHRQLYAGSSWDDQGRTEPTLLAKYFAPRREPLGWCSGGVLLLAAVKERTWPMEHTACQELRRQRLKCVRYQGSCCIRTEGPAIAMR
jgi:hypothetical protein